jgi:hypothetical protein
MKTCSKCKVEKPVSEFTKNNQTKTGIGSWCKCCKNKSSSALREKNVEEYNRIRRQKYLENPKKAREKALKSRYGLTFDDFENLLNSQNSKCAICNVPLARLGRSTHVDHCHTTGKVRGILCKECNTGLGKLGDNIDSIKKVIQYLERNQEGK